MRRFLLLLATAVAVLAPTTPALALGEHTRLRLTGVTWHPDQRQFRMTIRCDGTPGMCAGRLVFTADDGDALAVARTVRLRPRHPQRVTMRQAKDAEKALAEQVVDKLGMARIGSDRAPHPVRGSFSVEARPSCRSGRTLATSGTRRLFRLYGYGVFACVRGSRKAPFELAEEDDSIAPSSVTLAAVAGHYAAFVATASWKCYSASLILYDLDRRRIAARGSTGDGGESSANGCDNSATVRRLVLTPAGSVAWTVGPEADGLLTVRTLTGGHETTAERAATIDPRSLALSVPGGAVTWLDAGTRHSAPLP
jgi:hypothetical protein